MSFCGLCTRRRTPRSSGLSSDPQGSRLSRLRPGVSELYQYVPLNEEANEIRLLTLLPGTFSSEIRVCLDVTQFTDDHVPEFEAVSYVWGSVKKPAKILIGKSGRKTLAVTRNLAEALPYFRYVDKPRVLWIDAICVNQQNLKERGHQVKRMADIYSKAAKVLVWLGPESNDSTLAMGCLETIASKVRVDWNTQSISATTDEVHWADTNMVLKLIEAEFLAINHLLHRPWFERLWILQEVYLASGDIDAMCGNQKVPWQAVRDAVFCLYAKPKVWFTHQLEFMTRISAVYHLCGGKKDLSIIDLIHHSKTCSCSDPRDKIYALLSLLMSAKDIGIEPDYTKSVYEVYREAALAMIESTQSLEVLVTVESHEHLEGVPSWVPDKVEPISFNATSSFEDLSIELKRIAAWAGIQTKSCQSNELKFFARVITSNCLAETHSPPLDRFPTAAYVEETLHGFLTAVTQNELNDLRIESERAVQNIRHCCTGRSLYMTKDRVLGLAPFGAKPGDHVTVLLGCNTPMILRPTKEGSYKVVGEAYCNDFMNGEALLGQFPDPFKPVLRYSLDYESEYWMFLNQETGASQLEDPRLGPLPAGWSTVSHEEEEFWHLFVNDETGEITWKDPRLTSSALRKRGVPLQVFDLV